MQTCAGIVDRRLLERVAVPNRVHERHQEVQAGLLHIGEAAEALNDVRALLRHDDDGLGDSNERDNRQDDADDCQWFHLH
jgi:hypothetical protein